MNIFDGLVGLISPPQCLVCEREGQALCDDCTSVNVRSFGQRCYVCSAVSPLGRVCPRCRRLGGPRHVWISVVYEAVAEQLLELYKFSSHRPAMQNLARLMMTALPPEIDLSSYLVVALPTATSRRRQRGFDHAELLAREVARQLKLPYLPALARQGQSRQVGASRAERLRQISGAYRVRLPALVTGRQILLIDDVVTTGASLQAAAKTLRRAGARRIDSLIFAKKL